MVSPLKMNMGSKKSSRAMNVLAVIMNVTVVVVIAVLLWYFIAFDPSAKKDTADENVQLVNTAELELKANGVFLLRNLEGNVVLSGSLGVPRGAAWDQVLPTACSAAPGAGKVACWEWIGPQTKVKLGISVNHSTTSNISCHEFHWETTSEDFEPFDCFSMANAHWYGAAEMYSQRWPINSWNKTMSFYLSGDMFEDEQQYGSLLERYWLSSAGAALWGDAASPLHASINGDGDGRICLKGSYRNAPYPYPAAGAGTVPPASLRYATCSGPDIVSTHAHMVSERLGRPTDVPDERMIRRPVWSTWARYKVGINQSSVLGYAREILANNFSNSQLEIDDGYETHYGDFTFDPDKFPDAAGMVRELKAMGFRVTTWVTPFINTDSPSFKEGADRGYFIKAEKNHVPGLIRWWNGIGATVDMTNPLARSWYVAKLEHVRTTYGIDSFKFDAGEINYLPPRFVTLAPMVNPGIYTKLYAETAARFGGQVELRAGWQGQHLPVFYRMMDKDSNWGYSKGLLTLVPTALTFSVLGYPFILPDMIGGNAYEGGFHGTDFRPEEELYIRWLEVTAFMPVMQFSISPWQYAGNSTHDVVGISRHYAALHETIVSDHIVHFAHEAVRTGSPVIRPIWWLEPRGHEALTSDDEFLIGDRVLVAPVVRKGALKRNVYVPGPGLMWRDEMTGERVAGGGWLLDYPVPIDKIPWFTRV
ncbi:myogenesis-regulating glycosidase-like [Lethenteron reissneri]|uniref:myogenesis-regulating glycosidase-like n=1 Tax=Lethenteron reissneri TaxID=7753 RepID=UPI002AB7D7AF|nr:myogenesis-regulating glycosidase-like [Lethenteron reissneri]